MSPSAVDVHGFAGGFTLGMVQAGFTLVGKREDSKGFGIASCEANRHLLGHAWSAEATDPAKWSVVSADVVFGNPPCSGFSLLTEQRFRGASSPINQCMWDFAHYVTRVRPVVAVFESVQPARKMPAGHQLMRDLHKYVETVTETLWQLTHVLHNAYSLGGAAERRRYFWVISRVPFGVEIPKHDRYPVLDDVIGDLQSMPESWNPQVTPSTTWWSESRAPTNLVDGHITIDNPQTRRIKELAENIDWNPGEGFTTICRRYYEKYGALPATFGDIAPRVISRDFSFGFSAPVRWHGNRPARVITGGALQGIVHPHLPRAITYREVCRVMGFPDNWRVAPTKDLPSLPLTFGKGITVDCGRWIGDWILRALDDAPGTYRGTQLGEREFDIDVTDSWKRSSDTVKHVARSVNKKEYQMSEPTGEPTEAVEAEATAEKVDGRKGRPRPTDTVERDEVVFSYLNGLRNEDGTRGSKTRKELAVELELAPNVVYLCLYRLSRAERIVRGKIGGGHNWSVKDEETAPVEPELVEA